MPSFPKHPCAHPGCAALVPKGQRYCDAHKAQHPGVPRSSAQRGYNSAWQKARQEYLNGHPLCAECAKRGVFTKATVVDHIRPHRGDFTLFWDRDNWQPLCKSCHDKKTGEEDRNVIYSY